MHLFRLTGLIGETQDSNEYPWPSVISEKETKGSFMVEVKSTFEHLIISFIIIIHINANALKPDIFSPYKHKNS